MTRQAYGLHNHEMFKLMIRGSHEVQLCLLG